MIKMCKTQYFELNEKNLFAIKYNLEVHTIKNVLTNSSLLISIIKKLLLFTYIYKKKIFHNFLQITI